MKMANDAVQPWSFYPVYNLLLNNCETFATYLKTGIKDSAQASEAVSYFFTVPRPVLPVSLGPASVGSFGGSS